MAANNIVKVTMEQTEGDITLSRLTLEYPALENADANNINLTLVQGLLTAVRGMADAKKALSPT